MPTPTKIFGFATLIVAGVLAAFQIGGGSAIAPSRNHRSEEPRSDRAAQTSDHATSSSSRKTSVASDRTLISKSAPQPTHPAATTPPQPAFSSSQRATSNRSETPPATTRFSQNTDEDAPSQAGSPSSMNATTALDPAASGNRLQIGNQEVTVQSYEATPDGNVLTLAITDTPVATSDRPDHFFTLEEEQFRTKWGWVADDQVRRAALQSH